MLADSERAELNRGLVVIAKMLAGMVRYTEGADSVGEETQEYDGP